MVTANRVVIGEISGVYGVKGWLRIRSHTKPTDNIFTYRPWQLGGEDSWSEVSVTEGRRQGRGLVAKIEGIDDRDRAADLHGKLIAVRRDQLPDKQGEYYWADLEGLRVETLEGIDLGVVDHLIETGANDVLVVSGERQRLIPFVLDQYVRDIDLRAGRVVVDWDPDF